MRDNEPVERICETCRFAGWTGTPWYNCLRHAPTASRSPNQRGGVTEPVWPMVEARQWCGDYVAKVANATN